MDIKNKKSFVALISLLIGACVVGTLAYFSQDLNVVNKFKTAQYDTSIEEEFIPTDEWLPGVEVNKKVQIANSGNVPVVVRVKLAEKWVRSADIVDPNDPSQILSYKGQVLENMFVDLTGSKQDAAIKNFAKGMMFEYEEVKNNLASYENKWIHYDGYYYYLGNIGGGSLTEPLLSSVTMNPLLNSTVTGSHTRVEVGEDGRVETEKKYTYNQYGYDSANYTLTVEATTVQASKSAILSLFDKNAIVDYIVENFASIDEKNS